MDIDLFDYNLPPHLIAQFPTRRRDQSRLMILDRKSGDIEIGRFSNIVEYMDAGDLIVVNKTKVFKARLTGNRASGAKIEVFLVRPDESGDPLAWIALVSPSRRVKEGEEILFGDKQLKLISYFGQGRWTVLFRNERARLQILARHGHVPLPHYIRRDDQPSDLRRYQTVFADRDSVGAVAAPTAGFHFTPSLIAKLKARGVGFAEICLHVGPGTFKPVTAERIEDHTVDPEMATLDDPVAQAIDATRQAGKRVLAVGTTSVRTLESATFRDGRVVPFSGMVDTYIQPGHEFKLVDGLVTNFHLPKSSLIILVSAFTGRERILEAYQKAIREEMRFYSYGDAMLIL